jgi:NAD(P)-dependent dehydrogenase (short-subunit alcohol dehydrogenase family)
VSIQRFDGASAIVTGGAGGLGEAAVRRLHAEGLAVVISDLAEEKGLALAEELGPKSAFVKTDVTDDASVAAAIAKAVELGTFRYGVIAHGGFGGKPERVVGRGGAPADFAAFQKTIDIYLGGTYNFTRLAGSAISQAEPIEDGERGALVMTASIAGYEGQIGQSPYAAAKAGVIGLTIALARDLSSAGIRINTIAPGTMLTPMMASVGDEALAHFAASVPFPKRLGAPAEYGDAVAFLLANGYMNGEVIRLDGAQRFAPK